MSMLLSMLLLLGTAAVIAVAESADSRKDCSQLASACVIDAAKNVPVCGSDGVTYPNHCRLIAKQCSSGNVVHIKHSGPCPETPPCLSARVTARPGAKPVCRPDGTYAPMQCHAQTGYCWCVTAQGRPIANTSVRGARPRCNKLVASSSALPGSGSDGVPERKSGLAPPADKGPRRRSPAVWKQKRQYSNSKHRNNCDRADKARFNGNLIESFKIEYRRTNASSEDIDKNAERVLSWKFVSLDKNGDGYLDKEEFRELRRLAKKAVRPKKCARNFARTCDLDHDMQLSRQEWGACLANDFTHDRLVVPQAHRIRATDQVLKSDPSPVYTRPTFNDDPPEATDDTDANDCLSDQRSVHEDQNSDSEEKFYVPACTPDGRYHKVQCYSGYCWCVHQDTGKPIPGTSAKEKSPNCNPVPPPVRPMKGCPEPKKQQFLRDLMELMQQKMKASSSDSDEASDKWQASKEERVATWHFVMLDKNKNKVLERKEWKSFRAMVANNRQLRRCGKKLPRYCDINNDRKISMTEWLSCLNAQRPVMGDTSTEKTSTSKPRRMGPNPLDQFLNDDD